MANAVLTNLSPCLHEETDTYLLLHAADAVKKGHRKLCGGVAVDTNVVIAMFNQIIPDELWLPLCVGSNFCYIPLHEVVKWNISQELCCLISFSCICDRVRYSLTFCCKRKEEYQIRKDLAYFPDVPKAFKHPF